MRAPFKVSTLKSVVQEKTGLPTSKQKLIYEVGKLKNFFFFFLLTVVNLTIRFKGFLLERCVVLSLL